MKLLSKYKTIVLVISLIFSAGCSAAPSNSSIEETIGKHFEAKGYRVTALKIGDISPIPLSKKIYMGKPGYMVDVPSITLQPLNGSGNTGDRREEKKLTFSRVRILLRQGTEADKRWIIANMSGINVP